MSKVVLYIATSLDGFIARPDGNLDWLNAVSPPQLGDYGYTALLNSISAVIMGRKTYEEVIGFGIDWPYAQFDTYVVTGKPIFVPQSPRTCPLTTVQVPEFINRFKQQSDKDIWLVGGGQLNTFFINNGLLDKMIITVIPKIIGGGIPLFAQNTAETDWQLVHTEVFETGVVNLTYHKIITA
ncbi:MAG TPA: dihydrofolate reductase family protein [Chitinophagales bacterium]|nr:dihydrofolate reductase family protein [Chitinophagales bacterium]HRK28743.1 dihydrofolate reductase family protein [Chitinophagales bacterium]